MREFLEGLLFAALVVSPCVVVSLVRRRRQKAQKSSPRASSVLRSFAR